MEKSYSTLKKAQAWGMDLMIAIFIFTIAITIFFIFTVNQPGEGRENLENLYYDGKIIANDIFSEGYPRNWNYSDVVTLGVLTGNKINKTKLGQFYNLTLTTANYTRTKYLFNTKYDYYFFLDKNMTIGGIEVDGFGKPGETKTTIKSAAENLVKITRFTVYEDEPITGYIYIWE
jgi:hypothetical protein